MGIAEIIISGVIIAVTIATGILLMCKEPYQATIKNGGFRERNRYSNGKNIKLNRGLLVLSVLAGALVLVLILI